jgi:hypothetical protein
MESKTTQKIGLSFQKTGKRLSIDETAQWRTLYYFDQQSSKRKKGIVAMIAGTKAVIAIIEKIP